MIKQFVRWLHRRVEPDYQELCEIAEYLLERPPHETVVIVDDRHEVYVAVLSSDFKQVSPYIDEIIKAHSKALDAAFSTGEG